MIVSITIVTPELKDPQIDRLRVYFEGMERLLKMAAEYNRQGMEIRIHNNGHDRKEASSGTRA